MRSRARHGDRPRQFRRVRERLFLSRWPKEFRAALEGGTEHPLTIYGGTQRPKTIWFFTKDFLCRQWLQRDELREDWMALVRYGVPSRQQLMMVEQLRGGLRLPIAFTGALDPLDLCTFVLLRLAIPTAEIHYCGVN